MFFPFLRCQRILLQYLITIGIQYHSMKLLRKWKIHTYTLIFWRWCSLTSEIYIKIYIYIKHIYLASFWRRWGRGAIFWSNRFYTVSQVWVRLLPCMKKLTHNSWWFQPNWNICSSNWIVSQIFRASMPNIFEVSPPTNIASDSIQA